MWFASNPENIKNVEDFTMYKSEVGFGRPWLEFKILQTDGSMRIRYDTQEDWGKSYRNIISIKREVKLEGNINITF